MSTYIQIIMNDSLKIFFQFYNLLIRKLNLKNFEKKNNALWFWVDEDLYILLVWARAIG